MNEKLVDSIITMNGMLRIDVLNGLITFHDGWNRVVLRITHLQEPIPDDVLIDIVALTPLTSYTPLQGEALAKKPEKSGLAEWADRQEKSGYVQFDFPCPVCRKVHDKDDFTRWGLYTFIKDHEYITWTRDSMQKYARRSRMQFLGQGPSSFKYQLTFNARGPDRSTSGKFGGTQVLDARNIIKVEEVDRDPSKRHVGEIDRDMKRDDM